MPRVTVTTLLGCALLAGLLSGIGCSHSRAVPAPPLSSPTLDIQARIAKLRADPHVPPQTKAQLLTDLEHQAALQGGTSGQP